MQQRDGDTQTVSSTGPERGGSGLDVDWAVPVEAFTARSSTIVSVIAGLGAVVTVLSGIGALRRGRWKTGLARFGLGVVAGLIALTLRSSRERTGVQSGDGSTAEAATGTQGQPDSVEPEESTASTDQTDTTTTGPAAGSAVEPTVEGAGDGIERDADAAEETGYERFGAAAFDEYASEVPVPQHVFDVELLSLSAEAFWGVRERDDAVFVSHDFDSLQDADGVRYVGSSKIDGERTLSIPDVVLNHWSDAAGGGTVVESGTELTFATNDDLQADGQVLVVPAHSVDELLGEGG